MLNFGYWAAYAECALACYAAHLSPAMGISHRDRAGRDSFALDLIELMRPRVDRVILGVMAERLNVKHYSEDREGVVRVRSPLTHRIVSEVHDEAYAIMQAMFTITGLLDKVSRNRKR
jgi:CRISPR/Cas system-associated endonuclease Cas1